MYMQRSFSQTEAGGGGNRSDQCKITTLNIGAFFHDISKNNLCYILSPSYKAQHLQGHSFAGVIVKSDRSGKRVTQNPGTTL